METNALPRYDATDNPTGCCPRFNPEGWDAQELHFEDKLFVRATTQSENYVPTDMAEVFESTSEAIDKAGALSLDDCIILSRDLSPSQAEHLFSVTKPVPGQEMVHLTGDYLTQTFEGPYEMAPTWAGQIGAEVARRGLKTDRLYFFYTTCPKCAEVYGKNYVVGVAKTSH